MGRRPAPDNPPCPFGHAGRIRRHGSYSRRKLKGHVCQVHRRLRFLCVPLDPATHQHAFTLGRALPRRGECEHCDRAFTARDGPIAPRRHMHVVPDIARALVLVGQGMSYRRAGRRTRTLSGVIRWDKTRKSWPEEGGSDWGLVGDWVELYGGVAVAGDLPTEWPATGLLVDAMPFGAGAQQVTASGHVKAGYTSWTVVAGMAPIGPGNRLRMVRLRAYPGKTKLVDWMDFLGGLGGRPAFICSDAEAVIGTVAQNLWPGIVHRLAFDKLEHTLEGLLWRAGQSGRTDKVWTTKGEWHSKDPAKLSIFRSIGMWNTFVNLVSRPQYYDKVYVWPWIQRNDQRIRDQINAMPYFPHELAGLEATLALMREWFENRTWPMRNQWRTNLLLGLMTNELLERARQRTYARRIRAHLEAQLTPLPRHLIYASPRLH